MSDLNVFAFDTRAVRVVMVDGEPWFVAADVAAALGLQWKGSGSTGTLAALDEDEKGVNTIHTPGGVQEMAVISESGLYTLILRCRDAVTPGSAPHRFRRWVTHEVLPSIRKTGANVEPNAPGAMGVQVQPMPYLSHVADFHVAADRVFRSVLRSSRTAGVPLPTAVRQASAVTQAHTGMDMMALLDVHEHVRQMEEEQAKAPRHTGALNFWEEWSAGQLDGLPYQTCLAAQAYQAYTHWCSLAREGETARREVFTATIIEAAAQAGHPLRIKVMRVGEGGRYTHATATSARMLLVTEPPMEGQGVWATALVAQFDQHLRAWLGHKRSGVLERSP